MLVIILSATHVAPTKSYSLLINMGPCGNTLSPPQVSPRRVDSTEYMVTLEWHMANLKIAPLFPLVTSLLLSVSPSLLSFRCHIFCVSDISEWVLLNYSRIYYGQLDNLLLLRI